MFARFRCAGEVSYYASIGPTNTYVPVYLFIPNNHRKIYFNPPKAMIAINPGRPGLTYTPEKRVFDLPPT